MKAWSLILLFIPFAGKSQTLFEMYARPVKIVSTSYALGMWDVYTVVNSNAGPDTITLQPASSTYNSASGSAIIYHIKNIGSNYVYLKVYPSSGDSIEGGVSLFAINPANTSKEIQAASSHAYYIH